MFSKYTKIIQFLKMFIDDIPIQSYIVMNQDITKTGDRCKLSRKADRQNP